MNSERCPCCNRSLKHLEIKNYLNNDYCIDCAPYDSKDKNDPCGCRGTECRKFLVKEITPHPTCKHKTMIKKLTAEDKERSHQNWLEIEALQI